MAVHYANFWQRFWHEPIRAERLAITRILLAIALLTDQLIQYLPYLAMFYGPHGVAPTGVHDEWLLETWRWTILIFNTDDMTIITAAFWLRVAVTVALLLGWHTRVMSVLAWFLTMCFLYRNPALRNGADDVLMAGLFLLMLSPSGRALSLDRIREVRRLGPLAKTPPMTVAWPLRLIQIQVCIIYLTTGVAKLFRGDELFVGTWWDGTSLHYVLNDTTMSRFSYAQLPLPLWVTAPATYVSVAWEVLFTPLVMWRPTRKWTLWFGVLFHLGIFMTIEVGWFGFYTTALYGVWIPGDFWDRRKTEGNGSQPAHAPADNSRE